MSGTVQVSASTEDEINSLVPAASIAGPTVEFAFVLDQTVNLVGSSIVGCVVGQMNDFNGRHYGVKYKIRGAWVVDWFNAEQLKAC